MSEYNFNVPQRSWSDGVDFDDNREDDFKDSFNDCLSLGVSLGEHDNKQVFQFTKDRFCHTAIMGQTGCGKSNLVHQMEVEDIKSGVGVAIIASHPEDALYPLSCIPENRMDDVVLVDATDNRYAPCLNPLGVNRKDKRAVNTAIERVIDMIEMNNKSDWIGPRYHQMARCTLKLIMEGCTNTPNLGLVPRCYQSPELVKKYLKRCTDKNVFNYWTKVVPEESRSTEWGDVIAWFNSKFQELTDNDTLARVFRPRMKSVNFQEIVDQGKILVVYAPATEIGETASSWVRNLVALELRDAIMKRGSKPFRTGLIAQSKMKNEDLNPFYIYIDEFGEVASVDYVKLFSQARKRNAGCIISFQNLEQLRVIDPQSKDYTDRVLQSVIGNIGTFIIFNSGITEMKMIAKRFGVSSKLLSNPKKYQAKAFIRKDAETVGPYTLKVPKEPEVSDKLMPEKIQRNCLVNGSIEDLKMKLKYNNNNPL